MEKINQDTLIQLSQQNVARQKLIDEQNKKLDRILELTRILTSDVLPRYSKNGVDKAVIMEFIEVLRMTIMEKQNEKER